MEVKKKKKMKPLIYFDFKDIDDNNVTINKNRLKEILDETYNSGFEDGKKSNMITFYPDKTNMIRPYTDKTNMIGLCTDKLTSTIKFVVRL